MRDAADKYTVELLPLPSRTETMTAFSDFTKCMVTNVIVKIAGRTVYDGPPNWQKRGRGRPKLANPLTAAERARRYRLRKRHKNSGLF
jgi:hypothetical protein